MKRIVLINGLISGALITTFMLTSMWMSRNSEHGNASMVIGFTAMIMAFSLIIVAVKNQRDKINGGTISFGQAFLVGLYVSLIASTMYVIGWAIEFHYFMPDFLDKYIAMQVKALDPIKMGLEKYQVAVKEIEAGRAYYDSPVSFALVTYMEILPVGILMSLIIALIMKRKAGSNVQTA